MINRELTNQYFALINGYANGAGAHENFWSVYETEKSKILFPLFGGKTIIEKDIQVEKNLQDIKDDIEEKELVNKIMGSIDREFKDCYNHRAHWDSDLWTDEDREKMAVRRVLVDNLFYVGGLARQTFYETTSFTSPVTNKVVKLQAGSKISKALKHFISDKEKLEEVQVLYSQILNDKFLKGKLCLSIDPMDYLTASVNKSGWDSCYNTLDKNCWCASTLSLCSSPNTIMVYLKSSSGDAEYGWGDRVVTWNNKKWRTFVSLGENFEVIHMGRNYPYENLSLMEQAKEMIQELTKKQYSKLASGRDYVRIYTPENMYNDADCGDIYTAATEKYELGIPVYGREEIHISREGAICPTCGSHYDDCEFDVQCGSCGDHVHCADCGDCCNEDDRYYIASGDYYVCSGCSDSYYYCDRCGEYHEDSNVVEYRHHWYERHNQYYTEYICRHCMEQDSHIVECTSCENLVLDELVREDGTCYECSPIKAPSEF